MYVCVDSCHSGSRDVTILAGMKDGSFNVSLCNDDKLEENETKFTLYLVDSDDAKSGDKIYSAEVMITGN